jgi:16S rRNA (guanine966-N2)-methyltransferase
MRISGGAARSIQLKTLDLPELRPATDVMRQAMFNFLASFFSACRPPSRETEITSSQETMENENQQFPKSASARVRPWESKERTVGPLAGLRFLDLFAGCGAVGLEAVSRGAASGVFVERHPKLSAIIKENLAAVCKSAGISPEDREKNFHVHSSDVFNFQPVENSFDVIFCDPPYALIVGNEKKLLGLGRRALKPNGLFLWEHPFEIPMGAPEGFELIKNLGGKGLRTPNVGVFRRR